MSIPQDNKVDLDIYQPLQRLRVRQSNTSPSVCGVCESLAELHTHTHTRTHTECWGKGPFTGTGSIASGYSKSESDKLLDVFRFRSVWMVPYALLGSRCNRTGCKRESVYAAGKRRSFKFRSHVTSAFLCLCIKRQSLHQSLILCQWWEPGGGGLFTKGWIAYLLPKTILTIKLFMNMEQIRLRNSKSTDLDWYYN